MNNIFSIFISKSVFSQPRSVFVREVDISFFFWTHEIFLNSRKKQLLLPPSWLGPFSLVGIPHGEPPRCPGPAGLLPIARDTTVLPHPPSHRGPISHALCCCLRPRSCCSPPLAHPTCIRDYWIHPRVLAYYHPSLALTPACRIRLCIMDFWERTRVGALYGLRENERLRAVQSFHSSNVFLHFFYFTYFSRTNAGLDLW